MWTILKFKVNEFVHTCSRSTNKSNNSGIDAVVVGIILIIYAVVLCAAHFFTPHYSVYTKHALWTYSISVLGWCVCVYIYLKSHCCRSGYNSSTRISSLDIGYLNPLRRCGKFIVFMPLTVVMLYISIIVYIFFSLSQYIRFFLDSLYSHWIYHGRLNRMRCSMCVCGEKSARFFFYYSLFNGCHCCVVFFTFIYWSVCVVVTRIFKAKHLCSHDSSSSNHNDSNTLLKNTTT